MNRQAKIAIILLCFLVCAAGSFVASRNRERNESPKLKVIPVKNREINDRPVTWS